MNNLGSQVLFREVREEALALVSGAGVALTPEVAAAVAVTSFGLGSVREELGPAACDLHQHRAVLPKEVVMMPRQICPDHMHSLQDDVFKIGSRVSSDAAIRRLTWLGNP